MDEHRKRVLFIKGLQDYESLKYKFAIVRDMEATNKDHVEEMYRRPSHRERMRAIVQIMARYVPGNNFLDIGCAEGIYCSEAYRLRAKIVVGIDISAKKISRAKELYPDLDFRVADSDTLTDHFKNKFNFILCTEVLQHILDYKKTVKEAVSLLEKSGYLLLSVPNLSKEQRHIFAKIDDSMLPEELLKEIGGAGHGRQNAIWKFSTYILRNELISEYALELIEKIPIDTPDGEIKNLWTIFLLRKK
jgi:2-polyprenyl-3-methyl-5-hydroxy-6-metoxy-1,4-benzoquinol methylase